MSVKIYNGYKKIINEPPDKDNTELITDLKRIEGVSETERWNFVLKHYYIIARCVFGRFYRHTDEMFSEGTKALFDLTDNYEYNKSDTEELNVKRFYSLAYKYISGYIYKYLFFMKSQLSYPAFDMRTENPIESSIEKLIEISGNSFETEIRSFGELEDNFNAKFIGDLISNILDVKDGEIALTDVQKRYINVLQEANFNKAEAGRILQKKRVQHCGDLVASKICKFITLNPDKEDVFLNICNDNAKAYYKKIKNAFLVKNEVKKLKEEKELNKKKNVFSEEHRNKIIEATKKTCKKNIKVYQVLDPYGNIHETIEGLSRFCEKHNLCARSLLMVLKGKNQQHKGWKCVVSTFKTKKTITIYKVVSPDGIILETLKGLSDFCRNNGLSYDKMLLVAKGIRPCHKGWKVCDGYEIIPKLV